MCLSQIHMLLVSQWKDYEESNRMLLKNLLRLFNLNFWFWTFKLLASTKFYPMVKSLFTPEWWCVKWMATTESLKGKVDQIWQNTKKMNYISRRSVTHIIYNEPVDMMKRGEGNICWRIFINYGELHDNYQHFQDCKRPVSKNSFREQLQRTVDLFQRETRRRQWFYTFTLEQVRVWNKDLKTVICFSGSETSEPFNRRAWGGCSNWKILQTWTFSTLGYCLSGVWKRIISKAVIVKTNGDSKLLLFHLIFRGGRGAACFICVFGQLLYLA